MNDCIFLPGIIQPAVIRYAPLLAELGDSVRASLKELEVYNLTPPPPGFGMEVEVAALAAAADRAGLAKFHLYAHSGGGAVALAFTSAHPDRVLSLAVDEPAFDYTDEGRKELAPYLSDLEESLLANPREAMPKFIQRDLQPGVDFSPPAGVPPPLPNRPAGVVVYLRAFQKYRIDFQALRSFNRPVLYTRGTLSADRFEASSRRLAAIFPDYKEVVFEGLSHIHTSHQAEPARVAGLLRDLWHSG